MTTQDLETFAPETSSPSPTPVLHATALPGVKRFHGLDALRAAALFGGVVLHAAMSQVAPPAIWAVGVPQPHPFLGWLVFYLHSFRLEVFFLLAGFFGALVVGKRGVASYLRDRAVRVLLVFLVALYPMKLVLSAIWIVGGRTTGWLQLPTEYAALPTYVLALGSVTREAWPDIGLTHLWFLYVLACLVAVFVSIRAVVRRTAGERAVRLARTASRGLQVLAGGWAWPWLAAIAITPLLTMMHGMDIDTPDRSFAWHLPVLSLYMAFFAFGWWLHGHTDLLQALAARWKEQVALGLSVSLVAATLVGLRYANPPWVAEHAMTVRWVSSFLTALTMTGAVFGWLGGFTRHFSRPSPRARYLADASYWIYVVHLPLVVALQVAVAPMGWPWWLQFAIVLALSAPVLLVSYQLCVRRTWVGAWLNGRRLP